MLRLPVLVGIDLLSDGQTRVTEDELGITGWDAEVLEQRSGCVPQMMKLDDPEIVGAAYAVKRANQVACAASNGSSPVMTPSSTREVGRPDRS